MLYKLYYVTVVNNTETETEIEDGRQKKPGRRYRVAGRKYRVEGNR